VVNPRTIEAVISTAVTKTGFLRLFDSSRETARVAKVTINVNRTTAAANTIVATDTFRGLRIAKGINRIEMVYRPRTLTAAIVTSIVISILLLAAWLFRRRLDQAFAR
jgi:hypothetical protein